MYLVMDWKATALISGAGLLATWVFSMPGTQPSSTATQSTLPAQSGSQAITTFDIQREAQRLQTRLPQVSGSVAVSRNPFRFAAREADPAGQTTAYSPSGDSAEVMSAPTSPSVTLDGIATDIVNGQEQRTAILHTESGVQLVQDGDLLAGGYEVTAVGADFAELTSVSDGSVLRLQLR